MCNRFLSNLYEAVTIYHSLYEEKRFCKFQKLELVHIKSEIHINIKAQLLFWSEKLEVFRCSALCSGFASGYAKWSIKWQGLNLSRLLYAKHLLRMLSYLCIIVIVKIKSIFCFGSHQAVLRVDLCAQWSLLEDLQKHVRFWGSNQEPGSATYTRQVALSP